MKKLLTILLPALIITVAFTQTSLASKFKVNKSTAFAVGDLMVNWGVPSGQPIFTVNNIAPGDTQARTVQILNGANSLRPVGVRGIKTAETKHLAGALDFVISEGSNDLYGGSMGSKTLAQFLSESQGPDGIKLFMLDPGQNKTINFKVSFSENADNKYQGANVVFDIIVGIAIETPVECRGINFSGNPIFGTEKKDTLNGTKGNDLIFAFEGDDVVNGKEGDDCVVGGTGNDTLHGQSGNDIILGNEGNDRLWGDNGEDTLLGGSENDRIEGDNDNDNLDGESGNDDLSGGNGNDACLNGEKTAKCESFSTVFPSQNSKKNN